MKNLILLKITCLLFLLSSCKRADVDPGLTQITLKEGESKSIEMGGELTPLKLLGVNLLFSEGVEEKGIVTIHRVYKLTISIGNDTLDIHTSVNRVVAVPQREDSWEELSKRTGRVVRITNGSQLGIADIYDEQNSDSFVVKFLIKK